MRNRNKQINMICSVLLMTASMLLSGCGRKAASELFRYQASFSGVFDTVTTVDGYAPDEATFTGYVQTLQKELEEYHKLYDIYQEYEGINNIRTINLYAGMEPVVVDQKILDLLTEAVELCEETNGSVTPQKNAAHTDISHLILDPDASTVYLTDPDMSLDLGTMARGYATEMACRSLQKQGFTHALIRVGSNTRAIGAKPDGSCWDAALENPDQKSENATLFVMELSDTSLVSRTSLQELPNPQDRYAQVTILCGNAGRADALSTAIFNMEPEEGKRFVENQIGIEAMWIFPDGSQTFSSGFRSYIKPDDFRPLQTSA